MQPAGYSSSQSIPGPLVLLKTRTGPEPSYLDKTSDQNKWLIFLKENNCLKIRNLYHKMDI